MVDSNYFARYPLSSIRLLVPPLQIGQVLGVMLPGFFGDGPLHDGCAQTRRRQFFDGSQQRLMSLPEIFLYLRPAPLLPLVIRLSIQRLDIGAGFEGQVCLV